MIMKKLLNILVILFLPVALQAQEKEKFNPHGTTLMVQVGGAGLISGLIEQTITTNNIAFHFHGGLQIFPVAGSGLSVGTSISFGSRSRMELGIDGSLAGGEVSAFVSPYIGYRRYLKSGTYFRIFIAQLGYLEESCQSYPTKCTKDWEWTGPGELIPLWGGISIGKSF